MSTIPGDLTSRVEANAQQVIEWRRYLHQHPELSYQEHATSDFVCQQLESFGGFEISRPTETSVMARLGAGKQGKTVAMRADMDALPVSEENEKEYSSQNEGIMHACGHDAHTAIMLGTAKILAGLQDELQGEIRFLFQHAEEKPPGGAQAMVDAGVMDGVDAVVGAHVWSPLAAGKVAVLEGPVMAAPDLFDITIRGKGGHGAMPEDCVDPVAIGVQVANNLHQLKARNFAAGDPVVISVTQFHAGTANNVIPGQAKLGGTVRTYNPPTRERIPQLMDSILEGLTSAYGASYELEYDSGYQAVINDPSPTAMMREVVASTLGKEALADIDPLSVGEDFSAFAAQAPGCFILLGAGNEQKGITYGHHHPRFDVDEDILEYGVSIFSRAAFRFLEA